jgi:hypothetical protein
LRYTCSALLYEKNPLSKAGTGFSVNRLATPLPYPRHGALGRRLCIPTFWKVCPSTISSYVSVYLLKNCRAISYPFQKFYLKDNLQDKVSFCQLLVYQAGRKESALSRQVTARRQSLDLSLIGPQEMLQQM